MKEESENIPKSFKIQSRPKGGLLKKGANLQTLYCMRNLYKQTPSGIDSIFFIYFIIITILYNLTFDIAEYTVPNICIVQKRRKKIMIQI